MSDEQMAAAQYQIAVAEHNKNIGKIVQAGYEEHGEAAFDEISARAASHIGAAMPTFMHALAETDNPVALVEYLADHEDEAKRIGKMSAPRAALAMGQLQARLSPNTAGADAAATPQWRGARVEQRGLTDDISDDKWFSNYKRSKWGKQMGY